MTHPNVEELQRKRGDGAVGTGNVVALFTPALPQTRGRRCYVTTAAVSLGDRTFLALLAFGDPEAHCRRTGAEAPQHSAHGLHRSREGLPPERTGTQPAGDPHLQSERLGGGGPARAPTSSLARAFRCSRICAITVSHSLLFSARNLESPP